MTCPSCKLKREHTIAEMQRFHPMSVHGYIPETGWTHPQAKADHEAEAQEKK